MSRIRKFHLMVLSIFSLVITAASWAKDGPMKLTLLKSDQERKFVLAEKLVPASRLSPPFKLADESGKAVRVQWEPSGDGQMVRWLVTEIAAGASPKFTLDHSDSPSSEKAGIIIKEIEGGSLSISNADREITRYNVGPMAEKFKKPFFYPVMAHGESITRSWPMEEKQGETHDHPHHTGLYFAHGAVNGKDYWSKEHIIPKSLKHSQGPVYGHLIAQNAWGADANELQDILIIDVGNDVLMDWNMTLSAPGNAPVELGKTKEGSFALRVTTPLTSPDPGKPKQTGRGTGKMIDALGNQDEEPIRPEKRAAGKKPADWADNYGTIEGKQIGVCFMNHPTSYRYPTDWHVRNYGLFAANAFMLQADELKPNQPITFRYRVYIHGSDPAAAKVAAVYSGYANNKVEGE